MRAIFLATFVAALLGTPAFAAGADGRSLDKTIQLTYEPETRQQAIELLEAAIEAGEAPARARLALAKALSWEGRHDEALSHYEALIRRREGEQKRELEYQRLEVLLWADRSEEAARGYRALLESDPRDVRALVGLARARRYAGRPLAARDLAVRAADIAPEQPGPKQELAWIYADLGLADRATAQAAASGEDVPADLEAHIDRAGSPELAMSAPISTDSFGVTRAGPRAVVSTRVAGDVRLSAGGGLTYLEKEGTVLRRPSGAAAVTAAWPRFELRGAGGATRSGSSAAEMLQAELRVRLADRARARVSAARHPFFEMADPLASGEGAFHAAGGGGATDLGALRGVMENEAGLGLEWSPVSWTYTYLDARGRAIGDGNFGGSVAGGLGINVLAGPSALDLFARWDGYAAGYRETTPAYFSPGRFDSQTLGGELAWQLTSWLRLRGEGGVTFAVLDQAPIGQAFGGGASITTGPVELQARFSSREDPYFSSTRGWLSLTLRP